MGGIQRIKKISAHKKTKHMPVFHGDTNVGIISWQTDKAAVKKMLREVRANSLETNGVVENLSLEIRHKE